MPSNKLSHLAALAASLSLTLSAQPLDLSLENIVLNSSGARAAVLSPDGKWAAVTGSTDRERGIFLVPTGTGDTELWVENGGGASWSPDGKSIAFSRGGDLWTVAVGSHSPGRVTDNRHDERAPVFSPDGSMIAYYSSRGGYQDIWLAPSDGSGPERQLTKQAMAGDDPRFAPSWSPDGKWIAYVSNEAGYWEDDVWAINLDDSSKRRISKGLMASSTPAWSPDGSRLALLGTAKDEYWYEDLAYLYVLDPKGEDERIVDMQIHATDWLHNHQVYWSGDGSRLFFLYMQRGDFDLWAVPSEGGVATRVSNMGGAVRNFHASSDGSAFTFVRTTPLRGPEVDFITAEGGSPRRLTYLSPRWKGIRAPEEISYRSFDGLYIQGFLYRPPGWESGRSFPALVNVHGGGTNSYLHGQALLEQFLASQGYIVLAVNYRGGSGFGRPFQDLGINDWANGQARDAAAAGDFMRTLPYCNGKVGIYGYSYGGIMSMATIARSPKTFDAAVPMAGIYDFGDAYTNADRLGKIFIKTGHGGSPQERPEIYAVSNTLARLHQVETPLLIMHGEEDVRAPYRQFELAVKLLRGHGKQFESKSFPGEPHGFRNPRNRLDLYYRLLEFMNRHLKQGQGE